MYDYSNSGAWPQWFWTSGSALMALWAQCLRDTQANHLNFHGWSGAEGSAPNCILWACTRGDRRHHGEHFPECSFYRGIHSGSSLSGSAPVLPTAHCSSETDLGDVYSNNWGADPAPIGLWQPQRRSHSTFSAGSGHHKITLSCQGDNGQHTPRKDVAGIHTTNSPHTKKHKTHGCHTGTFPN